MADSNITIVGLFVSGGVEQNVLQWAIEDPNIDGLTYLRFSIAEIWMSTSPTMAGAAKIGEAYSAYLDQEVPRGQKRYYQVRAKNRSDQLGEFSAIKEATELSGDVLIANPGFWKHPSGLIMEWGIAHTDANGNAQANYFFNRSNVTLLHSSGIVQRDDTAANRTEVWGVQTANITFSGNHFVTNFQVRRAGHDGALTSSTTNAVEPAPAGIPVWFLSLGAEG